MFRHADSETMAWRLRASDAIPGGSSTGSKRPDALYGSEAYEQTLPTHYERAEGCAIITTDGRRIIDCTMALGAVAIGYGDAAVTRAVQDTAAAGPVSALPHKLEVEVAERLIDVIPCAEQVRFLRTGAEATAAAIRLARVATGKTHIIACGYFGWLDWCSESEGVPTEVREQVTWIPFNDIAALTRAVNDNQRDLAAIIVEPLIHEVASRDWLQTARDACDRMDAVLIFDEIKTAFRIRSGGVQELLDITPDLCTIGKALANGYPLAAVAGRAGVMEAAQRTWISSTAAAEATGLAAAKAVLDWHERVDVPENLLITGTALRGAIADSLATAPEIGVRVEGPAQMFRLVSDNAEQIDRVVGATVVHHVLLKRGAYQFAAMAHDGAAVERVSNAVRAACRDIAEGRNGIA